jgi:hypothetical protein
MSMSEGFNTPGWWSRGSWLSLDAASWLLSIHVPTSLLPGQQRPRIGPSSARSHTAPSPEPCAQAPQSQTH